jgi:hypothetical protein
MVTNQTPLNELEELVLRLRTLVREDQSLRAAGAGVDKLSAHSREIDALRSRLAELVRRDPTIPRLRRVASRRRGIEGGRSDRCERIGPAGRCARNGLHFRAPRDAYVMGSATCGQLSTHSDAK